MVAIHLAKSHCLPSLLYSCEILHDTHSEDMRSANVVWNNAFREMFNSFWREIIRGGFRHVQHVRPNSGPTKGAPTRAPANFLQHSNMPEIIEIIIIKRFCVARWRHKVSSQVLPAGIDNYLLAQRLAHVIL